jgi:agmatinase
MRAESYGLETYSPYQDLDLEDASVFDGGDLELCFGDTNLALNDITAFTKEILDSSKLPLMIGGEHLVTLGAVRAVAEKYPDLHIIHFDAHADLRDDYLGAKLSHGLEQVIEQLKGKPVYFTLDLDVLDPSVFPGTGTPEAGGVSFIQLLEAILKVGELDIVGCDINELSPLLDASGASTAVALKVLRELLLKLEERYIR